MMTSRSEVMDVMEMIQNLDESIQIDQEGYDRMSLLVGMRKASSVEDTVKCLDIKLRAEDIKCMEEAVKTIQVAVLDK